VLRPQASPALGIFSEIAAMSLTVAGDTLIIPYAHPQGGIWMLENLER
jgi:hypothetical protein